MIENEFIQFIIILICIVFARSITTLFHELGHAIPALIFSREPVHVYIGSYGEEQKYIRLKIGRLTIFFRFNFLDWRIGLCRHMGKLNYRQDLITTLGGPIMSLSIAVFLIIFMIYNELGCNFSNQIFFYNLSV